MRKYFIVAGALVALAIPSAALADVSTNGTTSDAAGYCNANHIANFNDGFKGIGRPSLGDDRQAGFVADDEPAGFVLRRHAGRLRADQQQQLSSTTDTRNGGWLRLAPETA